MIRKIVIEIDCGETTCDKCELLSQERYYSDSKCREYGKLNNNNMGQALRCEYCINDEE